MTAAREEDLAALIQRVIDENPGLTQKALADCSGIAHQTINAWVKRRRGVGGGIDPDTLRALAKCLPKTTVAEVFAAAGRRAPAELDAEREKKLLRIFRNLPVSSQRALIQTAEAFEQSARAAE